MVAQISAGDTAWILVCCSLVLLMTPALAFFYGGMVRRKNVLSTLTMSYIFMSLIGVQWVLYGYSLAFGSDIGGLIGGLNFLGFQGVGAEPNTAYAKTIPLTVLGTGLLWVGWFGFNAGSALGANGVAVNALVTTNTSAATAGLVWMLLSWLDGRPSTLGIATGMVVGLAAVTPACGYITPLAAMIIGAVAAPLSYYTMRFRDRCKLDESLDVWACHGMASTWGTIATGLFATVAVNADGANGLFFGNPSQLAIQIIAVIVTIAFSFGMTYVLAKALNMSIGLRVSPVEEEVGLDISSHGERSYS